MADINYRFGKHNMDCGNQAIQAAIFCEKTISMLNHLRVHHKDATALIRCQKLLAQRRKFLFWLKIHDGLSYHHILRCYGIDDLDSEKGEGIHLRNLHCKNPKRPGAFRRGHGKNFRA